MIVCDLRDAARYYPISPLLAQALMWIEKHKDDEFKVGSIKLDGDSGITVNMQEVAMLPRVPLKGEETMGWSPVKALRNQLKPYDPDADFELYGDAAHSMLDIRVGQIAIFYPEDAHAPNIGIGNHRKLCVKVPVD
ncbi:MAG TPA: YhcH/YjgK/YiaL family protein [Muribaculaceae bacterium]|nr:YhcH/YjgK/YiaL family protein [Muribaculaceae bacterium]